MRRQNHYARNVSSLCSTMEHTFEKRENVHISHDPCACKKLVLRSFCVHGDFWHLLRLQL